MKRGKRSKKTNVVNPLHYQTVIQPLQFIHKNQIGFIEGCIIKYVVRWREKGGKADLQKARSYLDKLIAEHDGDQDWVNAGEMSGLRGGKQSIRDVSRRKRAKPKGK